MKFISIRRVACCVAEPVIPVYRAGARIARRGMSRILLAEPHDGHIFVIRMPELSCV